MKKCFKNIITVIIIILLIGQSQVYALSRINPDDYKPDDLSTQNFGQLKTTVGGILGAINVVGVVISVVVICIIGLRYMVGSVEQKAEYKKTMLGYIMGAGLLFAATTLPNVLYTIGISIGT